MSRLRRGVVLSDDETQAPPAKRIRQTDSRAPSSRPSTGRPANAAAAARVSEAIINLPSVTKLPPEEVEKIRLLGEDTRVLKNRLVGVMGIIADAAVSVEELEASEEHAEMVANLEKQLWALIDGSQHVAHGVVSLERTCHASEQSAESLSLHETFLDETTAQDNEYKLKTPEDKYAHVAEYLDFKRRVWDIKHANQPAPTSWFSNPTDTPTVEDDDIVLDQEIQSLKCPLTLQLLEKPMRNTNCPHIYSLDAISELLRQGGGGCSCPVSGCAAQVRMDGLREDKVMARKVREERAREEERGERDVQDLGDMSEIIDDDEDVKVERRGSRRV